MLHKAGPDLLTSVKPEQINELLSFTLKKNRSIWLTLHGSCETVCELSSSMCKENAQFPII